MSECEHQYRRDVETCPWCELAEAEDQRDEAREVAAGLLAHLEVAWAANRDMAQVIEAQRQEVTRAVKRFYPWLKEQASVDEEEG